MDTSATNSLRPKSGYST